MKRLAIDLFAGTGGATAAFTAAGWDVLAVDLVRGTRANVVADCRSLPLRPNGREVGLLWASPPCTEFSTADSRVNHRTKRPSLELLFAALTAVRDLRPRFWVIENVRGAIPFLGVPAQKIGPWCLWGYFPQLAVTLPMHDHRKGAFKDAAGRGAVPLALSEALLQAIDRHWSTQSLLDLRPFRRHRHARQARPSGDRGLFE
jgi:hypothetical protein